MPRTALAIRHVLFEDLGLIEPLLAERGYQIRYLEAGVGPFPSDLVAECDLLVVLGGPVGVYDAGAYPFLGAESDAMAQRMAAEAPTLGLCLGAQLMASALGAEVTPTGRTEIGFSPLTLTPEGHASVLAPLAGEPVLHWHGDEFAIPDGATRLAETPGFPNQAFALGGHALGLQFHIEADHERIEQWLIGHAHELASAGIHPGGIRADAQRFGPALARRAHTILSEWLDQLG
ncbi:MAG: glutamine amidotransferase [Propioniciclava sp.]